MPKKTKKEDTLGMAPAVHRNQLEEQIKENVYKKYPSLEPDNKSKNA